MPAHEHMRRLSAALLALALLAPAGARGAPVDVAFLFNLSSPTGFIPFSGAGLSYDAAAKEIFVRDQGLIHVFNDSGMEVFTFGDSGETPGVLDLAPLGDGSMLALGRDGDQAVLMRLSFRGELLERFGLTGLPDLGEFKPHALRYRDGRLYLADLNTMRIVVADASGRFERAFDVAALLDSAPQRGELGFKAFNVDYAGNMLFTIQPLFHGYVLSLDGRLREFGVRGSAPGKFNVVSGIAADEQGRVYVSDILKSAVIVFDPELRFVKEFGGRSLRAGGLVAPIEVEAGNGKVFVSQYGRRGVSVFKVQDVPVG